MSVFSDSYPFWHFGRVGVLDWDYHAVNCSQPTVISGVMSLWCCSLFKNKSIGKNWELSKCADWKVGIWKHWCLILRRWWNVGSGSLWKETKQKPSPHLSWFCSCVELSAFPGCPSFPSLHFRRLGTGCISSTTYSTYILDAGVYARGTALS